MSDSSDRQRDWASLRQKVIGLGEESIRKSYYPELQERLRELQESKAWLQAIFDSVNDGILVYDSVLHSYIDINQRASDMFGYSREEFLKLTPGATGSGQWPYVPEYLAELLKRAIAGEIVVQDWHARRKNGELFWLEVSMRRANLGGEMRLVVVARDISERKEAGRKEREFYRRTISAATQGILQIVEREEMGQIAGPPVAEFELESSAEMGCIRNGIIEAARSVGIDEARAYDLTVAAGEAITNAFKHAGGGHASLHKLPGALLFVLSDKGPGIETLAIPQVALAKGYTTSGTLGMGYKVIISIASKVYLATGPEGTTVGIEMTVEPPSPPQQ